MQSMTPQAEHRRWWLGPLLWSLAFLGGLITACVVSEEAREVIGEGVGYLLGFFSTPFILEASAALAGLGIVMIINNLRLAREGDGWVEMEVKTEEPSVEAKPKAE
jgi:hypothetical protein